MTATTEAAWHACVLVPARNEEELLPRCLASILAACDRLPKQATCDIVVAVDSSTDETATVAERMLLGRGVVVLTDAGQVGSVRQTATITSLRRFKGALSRCWLAYTDADCIVPHDWLVKQLDFADQNMKAIAGVVSVDNFRDHSPLVEARFHATYLLGRDGDHSHVHGANLGIRADLFQEVGGWSSLSTGEDHEIWSRVRAHSRDYLATTELSVVTSGRRVGRAPQGFAAALAAHGEAVA